MLLATIHTIISSMPIPPELILLLTAGKFVLVVGVSKNLVIAVGLWYAALWCGAMSYMAISSLSDWLVPILDAKIAELEAAEQLP